MTRFVKWPEYVRLQRQRVILNQRLKVPPAIAQFSNVLDKNTATQLFALMNKYKPESKQEKKARLQTEAENKTKDSTTKDSKKPLFVKYGLNHVVALVEAKKAQLVVIAADVDPIELVVFLPVSYESREVSRGWTSTSTGSTLSRSSRHRLLSAVLTFQALCRKQGIPYVIVAGKSRIGITVNKKTAAVAALTEVRSEDAQALATLVSAAKANYLEKHNEISKHWGGGKRGNKSTAKLVKRAKKAGVKNVDTSL